MSARLLATLALFCFPLGAAEPTRDFARDIHPILAERCFACHGGDKRAGGLSLRGYDELLQGGRSGAVIVPGKPEESLLIRRVLGEGVNIMPPVGEHLSPQQIALLNTWIAEGARASLTSEAAKPRWTPRLELTKPAQPLDAILAPYTKGRLVSDTVFARRAYLDVWGLLPSPEELAAFLKHNDRAQLVDHLLAGDRNYSEHWITFWNDLLRNDEGVNYAGTRKSITPWLLASLEHNKPYNLFVSELLNPRGDSAPDGFLTGVNWRGDVSASQLPVMQAAQNSAQVFLGVNLKCNSCHDSFISKWRLKDAYGLAAFFSDQPKLELVRCDQKTDQFTGAHFLYPALDAATPPVTLEDRRDTVARLFVDPRNGRTPRTIVNRVWQRLLGRGIVENVDDMDGEPWSPELLDWLAADFVEHGYDLKHLVRTILTSRAYQLPSVPRSGEQKAYTFRGPELRRLSAEEFVDNLCALTGEWRTYRPSGSKVATYSREWRLASTQLTRSLGRPIRDQVYTERSQDATTLQLLELVNGETLTGLLSNGSKRMLGRRPPAPGNLWDSGSLSDRHVDLDLDITGIRQLHLVVADMGSYSPERVQAFWADAKFIGPSGETPLGQSVATPVVMKGITFPNGIRASLGSDLVIDIAGKGYTRLKATVGLHEDSLASDISPSARFFVFDQKPDFERLIKIAPGTPVPPVIASKLPNDRLIDRLFTYSLGRTPTPSERKAALVFLNSKDQAAGLADLIWSISMLPEFQFIL